MNDDETFDSVWDRVNDAPEPSGEEPAAGAADAEGEITGEDALAEQMGPPIRVTIIVKSESIPVAPWAQGWQVGAIGPHDGHVTLIFEHEIMDSPVAQLSAVTGLLATVKAAKLDMAWWAIQTRGPFGEADGGDEAPAADDFDQQLSEFLLGADDDQD